MTPTPRTFCPMRGRVLAGWMLLLLLLLLHTGAVVEAVGDSWSVAEAATRPYSSRCTPSSQQPPVLVLGFAPWDTLDLQILVLDPTSGHVHAEINTLPLQQVSAVLTGTDDGMVALGCFVHAQGCSLFGWTHATMAGQNAPAWEVALPETGLDIMEQVDGDRVLQSGGGIVAAVLPLESSQWELMAFHPQTGAHQGTWNLTIPLGSSPSLWTLHTDGSRALIPGGASSSLLIDISKPATSVQSVPIPGDGVAWTSTSLEVVVTTSSNTITSTLTLHLWTAVEFSYSIQSSFGIPPEALIPARNITAFKVLGAPQLDVLFLLVQSTAGEVWSLAWDARNTQKPLFLSAMPLPQPHPGVEFGGPEWLATVDLSLPPWAGESLLVAIRGEAVLRWSPRHQPHSVETLLQYDNPCGFDLLTSCPGIESPVIGRAVPGSAGNCLSCNIQSV